MADEFCLAAKKLSNEVGATVFCTQRTGHAGEHVARIGGYGAPVHRWSDEHECARCADLSPIETELVAQARLITNAKYEAVEWAFIDMLVPRPGLTFEHLQGHEQPTHGNFPGVDK